jgi:hypothetical protein
VANDLSVLVPKLLAQGLKTLRQQAFLPRIINRGYQDEAARPGDVVTIPIPSAVTAEDVVPSNVPPVDTDIGPTSVTITLDKWKKADFTLTDKDMELVSLGVIPMQAEEAVKVLVNAVNASIFDQYHGIYGYVGTAGTTPFGSGLDEAVDARKVLFNQMAPPDNRSIVLNADAEANALKRPEFSNQQWRVGINEAAIASGQIARTMGFDWYAHQLVPSHTAGTVTGTITVNANTAAGVESVVLAAGSGEAIALKRGDIITFAGHTQTYAVQADLTVAADSTGTVSIQPPLQAAVTTSTSITVKASHAVNLAFHRDAFAFVTKPLNKVPEGLGSIMQSMVDPLSGVALRLEISRQYKQVNWSFDILWGCKLVRAALATRIAG